MINNRYYPANFICKNKKCKENKNIKRLYIWQSDLDKEELPICSSCKKMLIISTELDKSSPNLTINIGKFSSMTREQKANSLKKRSKEHFNKKLKDERKHKWLTNEGMGNK
jgi:hypothetical protein